MLAFFITLSIILLYYLIYFYKRYKKYESIAIKYYNRDLKEQAKAQKEKTDKQLKYINELKKYGIPHEKIKELLKQEII